MQPDPNPLTPQEARIFELLAQGFLYVEIALQMEIKPATVRDYATNARDKLGATTMFEAAVIAERKGLLQAAHA